MSLTAIDVHITTLHVKLVKLLHVYCTYDKHTFETMAADFEIKKSGRSTNYPLNSMFPVQLYRTLLPKEIFMVQIWPWPSNPLLKNIYILEYEIKVQQPSFSSSLGHSFA